MVVRGPAGIGTDSKHKFHIEVRLGEKQGRKVKSVWGKGLWRQDGGYHRGPLGDGEIWTENRFAMVLRVNECESIWPPGSVSQGWVRDLSFRDNV